MPAGPKQSHSRCRPGLIRKRVRQSAIGFVMNGVPIICAEMHACAFGRLVSGTFAKAGPV
jgi:hypothetical protein